jgi:hypothetical protein
VTIAIAHRGVVRTRAFGRGLVVLALTGAVLASLVLAVGASSRRLLFFVPASLAGFPAWMRGPLSRLDLALTPFSGSLLLLALCACYLVALAAAGHVGLRAATLAVVAAHVLFMLAAPLYSADVFGYVDYARLGVLHDVNPYLDGAAAAPHDAVRPYVRWSDFASAYGPLFTIASYPLAWLGVPAALWTLKALACAASLGCVALVARIARQLGRDVVSAVLFVGLNPVLVAYGVGGGHNDFFAVLVMLAAISLALGRRDGLAAAGFVTAAAVKASGGVALPFMLVAQRSWRAITAAVAALAAVALVSVLAFGGAVVGVAGQILHAQQMVAVGSVPSVAAGALGLDEVTAGVRAAAGVTLAAGLGVLLWRTWRGADWIAAAGWATLLLLVTSAWFVPWYVVWLLPIAAVAGSQRLRMATLAFTAFVVYVRVAPYLTA